jgi:small subunit ribosomal protein S18
MPGPRRRNSRDSRGSGRRYFPPKRKVCRFCERNVKDIDYKKADILRKYTLERGKITPRRVSGTCSYHQRRVTRAIKRARLLALLPYISD